MLFEQGEWIHIPKNDKLGLPTHIKWLKCVRIKENYAVVEMYTKGKNRNYGKLIIPYFFACVNDLYYQEYPDGTYLDGMDLFNDTYEDE